MEHEKTQFVTAVSVINGHITKYFAFD